MISHRIGVAGTLLALLTGPGADARERLPVQVKALEREAVPLTLTAFGVVEKHAQQLHFETQGQLAALHADRGERVSAGQLLAQLDTASVDTQLQQARQAFAFYKGRVEDSRHLKRTDAVSQDLLEQQENDYQLQRYRVQAVEIERRRHFLRAPADGVLLYRQLDFPGPVDTATPVFTVKEDRRPWQVTAQLTGLELARVAPGTQARVHWPDGTDTFGAVERVAQRANNDGLFEVDIALDTHAEDLTTLARLAGLPVEVSLYIDGGRAAYRIPLGAFVRLGQDHGALFLLAPEADSASRRRVQFLRVAGTHAIIGDDLVDFDRVVVDGQHNLQDGSPVTVTDQPLAAPARDTSKR